MDIISHGLWGGVAFGRKSKKSYWLSFLFGILPDLVAFGPFFLGVFLGIYGRPNLEIDPESASATMLPSYVHQIYSISHSLVVFAVVFAIAWLIFKKPILEMLAWPLHIIVDIPTHSYQFFPTPFLWPISNLEVNGHPWATPEIFIPNIAALIIVYTVFYFKKLKKIKA